MNYRLPTPAFLATALLTAGAHAVEPGSVILEACQQTKRGPRTLLLKGGAKVILDTPQGMLVIEAGSIRVTHDVVAPSGETKPLVQSREADDDVHVMLGNKLAAHGGHVSYEVAKQQLQVRHRALLWQAPQKAEALTIDVATGKATLLELP
jgi:hypothetical protein